MPENPMQEAEWGSDVMTVASDETPSFRSETSFKHGIKSFLKMKYTIKNEKLS
ncbi:hypothetical protein AA0313_1084 [Acetobacter indonesiensis NRIC 0313]|uniref:Uncharacterized protein n=1 Tax=Acetobacter indonesiensis TaxID=104101 RepID=A0A6N3T4Q2_9PROT|nr:hypothetical protein Abin_030_053 [Acetobacter indonesiensis]GBQ56202.1 hypothetical protein AA0313_1084 [Acetobacter indonesiensis NRIC 0313]GEN02894.1 hypothetical protein AIN02nite_09190 [Acetobacter indonesiensis]